MEKWPDIEEMLAEVAACPSGESAAEYLRTILEAMAEHLEEMSEMVLHQALVIAELQDILLDRDQQISNLERLNQDKQDTNSGQPAKP